MSTNELCKVNQDKKQSLRTQEMLKKQAPRLVPPFSIQSLQKNTKVIPYNNFNRNRKLEKKPRCTSFRIHYERGDLPLRLEYFPGGARINWTVDLNKLNYHLYLPLFFDGLSEHEHPYKTYARQGVRDLIHFGRDKIYPVIPQLIVPIKSMCLTCSTTAKTLVPAFFTARIHICDHKTNKHLLNAYQIYYDLRVANAYSFHQNRLHLHISVELID